MPEFSSDTYLLPDVCAICGADGTNYFRKIKQYDSKRLPPTSLADFADEIIVGRRFSFRKSEFQVPTCAACEEKIKTDREERYKTRKQILIGAPLATLLLGIPISAATGTEFSMFILYAFIVGVGVGLLTAVVANYQDERLKKKYSIDLGSYNGRYYRFSNAKFMAEFSKLNADKV